MNSACYLIVGLGNPGREYAHTRHNMGFLALQAFARKYKWNFKTEKKLESEIARGEINGREVILMLPQTFMNQSGRAVLACSEKFKVAPEHLLIVVDDVDLPFGCFRLKKEGSSGGHNGLKSIEWALQTQEYSRLRIGIGRENRELVDYVLEEFSLQEKEKLPQILQEAVKIIEASIDEGVDKVMTWANMNRIPDRRHDELKKEN